MGTLLKIGTPASTILCSRTPQRTGTVLIYQCWTSPFPLRLSVKNKTLSAEKCEIQMAIHFEPELRTGAIGLRTVGDASASRGDGGQQSLFMAAAEGSVTDGPPPLGKGA